MSRPQIVSCAWLSKVVAAASKVCCTTRNFFFSGRLRYPYTRPNVATVALLVVTLHVPATFIGQNSPPHQQFVQNPLQVHRFPLESVHTQQERP